MFQRCNQIPARRALEWSCKGYSPNEITQNSHAKIKIYCDFTNMRKYVVSSMLALSFANKETLEHVCMQIAIHQVTRHRMCEIMDVAPATTFNLIGWSQLSLNSFCSQPNYLQPKTYIPNTNSVGNNATGLKSTPHPMIYCLVTSWNLRRLVRLILVMLDIQIYKYIQTIAYKHQQ